MRKASIALSLFVIVAATAVNAQSSKKLTFYYVDHGTPGMFWSVYYKGIEDATRMLAPLGVEVKHLEAGEVDFQGKAETLQQAVAANPDGLVTSIGDPKTYESILKPLIDKGVPIMAANTEDPRPVGERIPYLAYYGEDTSTSGTALADALIADIKESGGKKPGFALLVTPVAGSPNWVSRLKLFGERLAREYGTKSEQVTDTNGTIMSSYLQRHPNVDVVCAFEGEAHYYLSALRAAGKVPGKDVYVVCFNVGASSLQDIKDGTITVGYDEQQYLQGFLPLYDLYLYLTRYHVHPVRVITGMLVDRHNADSVLKGALMGYR